jgi:alcohol dehydrogenase class IV
MTFHQYNFPTKIQYGPGALSLLPQALQEIGAKRPLLVTDRALASLPPVASAKAVLAKGFEVAVYSEIWGNPSVSQATQGAAAFQAHGADAIVSLGGGAALDVAKCIAVLAQHPGPLLEYDAFLPEPRPIGSNVPPIIAIPTTAGTGSEVGRSAVVSDDVTHQKKIIFSPVLLAKRVLLDPELTVGLPAKVTAATGMDALTHCIESYLAKPFHPMCDGIALEGVRLIRRSLPACVRFAQRIEQGDKALLHDAEHVAARGLMLNAAMMGAVAFQKDLGVVHSCAHALSTVADLHHGLANGVMLPFGMRFNAQVSSERMAVLAEVVGAPQRNARGFIDWLIDFSGQLGIPHSLRELGVGPEHLARLVEVAVADACHQFNPRPVSATDFEDLFQQALTGKGLAGQGTADRGVS